MFDAYHEGFRAQTKGWTQNPVDLAAAWLRTKPPGWVVADLGCGDAQLARELDTHTVLSYDLVARNELVTACNMASIPCEAGAFPLVSILHCCTALFATHASCMMS